MGHRAFERAENKLNKNGSLLNLKQTMLESIKVLHESVPFFRLKNALISGNNFRRSRYSGNLIASVIMIQQITYLIGLWIESIICADYSPAVPAACCNCAVWQLRWSADGLMDGKKKDRKWAGNHQPPGLIHGEKKKPHLILLFWWLRRFPPTMAWISAEHVGTNVKHINTLHCICDTHFTDTTETQSYEEYAIYYCKGGRTIYNEIKETL